MPHKPAMLLLAPFQNEQEAQAETDTCTLRFTVALHIVAKTKNKPGDHQQIHEYTKHGVHMQPKKMGRILPNSMDDLHEQYASKVCHAMKGQPLYDSTHTRWLKNQIDTGKVQNSIINVVGGKQQEMSLRYKQLQMMGMMVTQHH